MLKVVQNQHVINASQDCRGNQARSALFYKITLCISMRTQICSSSLRTFPRWVFFDSELHTSRIMWCIWQDSGKCNCFCDFRIQWTDNSNFFLHRIFSDWWHATSETLRYYFCIDMQQECCRQSRSIVPLMFHMPAGASWTVVHFFTKKTCEGQPV